MTIDSAAPSGQFAALVKKSWMMLPYIDPALPPTRSGVTYSPTVGMKHHEEAGDHAGQAERQRHPPEPLHGRRAQVGRGFEERGSIRCRPARIGNATNGIQT